MWGSRGFSIGLLSSWAIERLRQDSDGEMGYPESVSPLHFADSPPKVRTETSIEVVYVEITPRERIRR